MKTIDVTPTWVALVPLFIHIAQHAETATAKQDLAAELTKMAQEADRWNAHCKASK